MKKIVLVLLCYWAYAPLHAQTTPDSTKPLSIGQVKTFYSSVLKEKRTLNIYLPPKYDSTKTYPVLYLLDGSMDEDFIHITGLLQFFNLMFNMPETIIVGIANVDRKRDFTFKTEKKELLKENPAMGNSAPFIRFLETELVPLVQQNFKTNGVNYLLGQSLGGLLATEVLVKKPALFSHYLIVSPSLWWDDESLLKLVKQQAPKMPAQVKYIYISVGKKEHPVMQKDARALYDLLKPIAGKDRKVDFQLMPDNHATILHNSIYEALLKLFPYKEPK